MRGIYTFASSLLFILNHIECSSLNDRNPAIRRNHGSPSSGDNLSLLAECCSQIDFDLNSENSAGPSSPGEHQPPDETAAKEASDRDRSRSPASAPPPIKILGYSLRQLGYIRLIAKKNETLQFELRRYVFSEGKPIRMRAEDGSVKPVPAREHIVLSTSDGDIFAILEYNGILRALFTSNGKRSRIKLNMMSGEVERMTPEEMQNCPTGKKYPVFPNSFIKSFANENSLCSLWNPHIESEESPLHAKSRSLPRRPPPDKIFNREIEKLGYVRLIPRTNHNKQFEFRRYVFPHKKQIQMRIDQRNYILGVNQEYLVLSAFSGDVFAILDYSETLRGIYRTDKSHSRVKVNMISAEVHNLTPDEIRDCPVGKNHPIFPKSFIEGFSNFDSLKSGITPDREHHPASSSSSVGHLLDLTLPEDPPSRPRATSPPGRPPSHEVLGYPLAKLGYIRLIPDTNKNRRFEFRRYVFPAGRPIRLQFEHQFLHVPNREHIVVSTPDGEVFAILEYTGILRGIYSSFRRSPRVKINMMSGAIENMTENERKECNVGNTYKNFSSWFTEYVSNEDSLQHVYR